jgi:DNA-binding response OmpR family regulator
MFCRASPDRCAVTPNGNPPHNHRMRILVIEDDAMIGKAVCDGLGGAGYSVDWVQDGRAAEVALGHRQHDLAVLDLGLPRQGGMAVLEKARAQGNPVPVLIATARDALADRIAGLNAGAGDYVLKPFDLDELVARIRAILRRHAGGATTVLKSGPLKLDQARKSITLDDQPVALSAREFALLEILMLRPGAVVSRQKLEESLYGWGDEVGSNAVEVHLHHLRRKIGSSLIRNVRGVGWRVVEQA